MTIRSLLTRTGARALSMTAMMALLALPAAAHSDDVRSDDAMDVCIQAFIAANLPKEQKVTVRKEDLVASPLDAHKGAYKILLTATGAASGKRLAKGTCTIDRTGAVVALNGKAISQQLAAR